MFVGFYITYVIFLIMASAKHDALEEFRMALFLYVAPLTAATLGFIVWRGYKERALAASSAPAGQ